MGLITAGRRKSMGLITAGRLARMTIIVLTSLNVLEIMFGMISLTEMISDRRGRSANVVLNSDASVQGLSGAGAP